MRPLPSRLTALICAPLLSACGGDEADPMDAGAVGAGEAGVIGASPDSAAAPAPDAGKLADASVPMPGGGGMQGPRIGHSWPAMSGRNWMAAHRAPGCSPSVALVQTGGGTGTGIGNGGGYGGIYCFALTP